MCQQVADPDAFCCRWLTMCSGVGVVTNNRRAQRKDQTRWSLEEVGVACVPVAVHQNLHPCRCCSETSES